MSPYSSVRSSHVRCPHPCTSASAYVRMSHIRVRRLALWYRSGPSPGVHLAHTPLRVFQLQHAHERTHPNYSRRSSFDRHMVRHLRYRARQDAATPLRGGCSAFSESRRTKLTGTEHTTTTTTTTIISWGRRRDKPPARGHTAVTEYSPTPWEESMSSQYFASSQNPAIPPYYIKTPHCMAPRK